jgi:hypothetical protein
MDTTPLLATLEARFAAHPSRHPGLIWEVVAARLAGDAAKLRVLAAMEGSGGEPDVIGGAAPDGSVRFIDCAPQSPNGRRSCCYDELARTTRKKAPPAISALGLAAELGIELLDEAGYRALQAYGPFDTTTSSWIVTPPSIRALGGALFGDWRYGEAFVYHNGADSYYGARGFRGMLVV